MSARRLEPVEARHLDVEDREVGPELVRQPDGLVAAAGLAHDLVALLLQGLAQVEPDDGFVLGDQDTGGHVAGPPAVVGGTIEPSCPGPSASGVAGSGAIGRRDVGLRSLRPEQEQPEAHEGDDDAGDEQHERDRVLGRALQITQVAHAVGDLGDRLRGLGELVVEDLDRLGGQLGQVLERLRHPGDLRVPTEQVGELRHEGRIGRRGEVLLDVAHLHDAAGADLDRVLADVAQEVLQLHGLLGQRQDRGAVGLVQRRQEGGQQTRDVDARRGQERRELLEPELAGQRLGQRDVEGGQVGVGHRRVRHVGL